MKRSRKIVLVLSGTLATGAFVGCQQSYDGTSAPAVSESASYTNNHYMPGVGYYHAPYRGWYPYPYNYYAADRGFFHGGNWTSEPHQSPVTTSQPTPISAHAANVRASPVPGRSSAGKSRSISRGGFGGSSHGIGA